MSKIIETSVNQIMKSNFINYAMYVIGDRALPDVRDGLKPVHRRILFAMNQAGMTHNKPYKKSARMVGDVIGKYHPHGDTAVYEASVRMAQDFVFNIPLIDGQGNFGSIDGDSPAAMRYTEQRLSKLSNEFFAEIRKETVDFRDNYDNSEREPCVLPVSFPNLVVNGISGIAVGMASEIPPHNLGEVIDLTLKLMDHPELSVGEIISILKGPDFPTKGILFTGDDYVRAVETGSGKVVVRARYQVENRPRGGERLIITELPYRVNKAKLVEKIGGLVRAGEIEGITYLGDESDNKIGIRVVMDIKSGESAEVVMSQLFSATECQQSIGYNIMAIKDGRPQKLSIKQLVMEWINFRREVMLKRYIFERKEAQSRLHILEGFVKALSKIDQVIEIIKKSQSGAAAKQDLMKFLEVDDVQAQAILDLRLQKLTGMEQGAIHEEHQRFIGMVEGLTFKIENPQEIDKDIKEQLTEIKSRYGYPRRSEIQTGLASITREDLIEKEEVYVILTEQGYVKRMTLNSFASQNRGTKGKKGIETKEGDRVRKLYQVNTHDMLLIFDKSGQVYGTKGYSIPEGKPTDRGRHIKNVIEGFEKEIYSVMAIKEQDEQETYILTVTEQGLVKKTSSSLYKGSTRKGGVQGAGLNPGDSLFNSFICRDEDELVLVSDKGRCARFKSSAVRASGRTSVGVCGMKLEEGSKIVGAFLVPSGKNEGLDLLAIGEQGIGKKTALSEYPVKGRAGKGMITFKTAPKTGSVVGAICVTEGQEVLIFSEGGVSNKIRSEDVPRMGRSTSGVRLMSLKEGDRVLSFVSNDIEPELDED